MLCHVSCALSSGRISILATDDIRVSALVISGDQCSSFLPLPLQVLDNEYYIINMQPSDSANYKAYVIVTSYEDENVITPTWSGKAGAMVSPCGGTAIAMSGTTATFTVDRQDPVCDYSKWFHDWY